MDIASPIPAAAPLAPPASPGPETTPPWRIEPEASPAPRRKPGGIELPRIEAQPVPWAIVALTLATALMLVFGNYAGPSDSRVATFEHGAD